MNFNPRAPCGARPQLQYRPQHHRAISILAPLTGRDWDSYQWWMLIPEFQSSRPLRGATERQSAKGSCRVISILAPLTGRDVCLPLTEQRIGHFNPRAPYGARLHPPGAGDPLALISILAPLTGRDTLSMGRHLPQGISILAPLTGRDLQPTPDLLKFIRFQSSRPLRGATGGRWIARKDVVISILAPLTGRDLPDRAGGG